MEVFKQKGLKMWPLSGSGEEYEEALCSAPAVFVFVFCF